MSYQASVEDGMRAAGRLLKEGGAEAVKLEGGEEVAELVHRLVSVGIPVMGHVGMTRSRCTSSAASSCRGRTEAQARTIVGRRARHRRRRVYAMVLESISGCPGRGESPRRFPRSPSASAPELPATVRCW